MTCKEGQFDVVELMASDQRKTFGINLNAQHLNGMTPFDFAVHIRCSRLLRYIIWCNFPYFTKTPSKITGISTFSSIT